MTRSGELRIVADGDIPFLRGALEPYAEVVYLPGAAISAEDVRRADALIVRTRTRCDASLLEGSSVRCIATATIGTDHIDLPWCSAHGISVFGAAGCNSSAVMQYVFTALVSLGIDLSGKTLGVIGVGHVGSKVAAMGRKLGFRVLCCDPPRAATEGSEGFVSQEQLLVQADIVTLHVPLDDSTRNMADAVFFEKMKPGAVFINCARGEVMDEEALIKAAPRLGSLIIDTWPHEPDINRRLLSLTSVASPHVAGYSLQGKLNGTTAAVRAVAGYLGIDALKDFVPEEAAGNEPVSLDFSDLDQEGVARKLLSIYPILNDDSALRAEPENFELLRSEYRYRQEFC